MHAHSLECTSSTTGLYQLALTAACTNSDQSITVTVESSQSIHYSELLSCIQAGSEDHALLFSQDAASCNETEVKYAGCNCISDSPQQCWEELASSECQQVCILWFVSKYNNTRNSYFIILPGESASAKVMEMLLSNSCAENTNPPPDSVCCAVPTSSQPLPPPGVYIHIHVCILSTYTTAS